MMVPGGGPGLVARGLLKGGQGSNSPHGPMLGLEAISGASQKFGWRERKQVESSVRDELSRQVLRSGSSSLPRWT